MPDQVLTASTDSCEDTASQVTTPVDDAPAVTFPLRRPCAACEAIGVIARHGWRLPSGFEPSSWGRSDRVAPRTQAGPHLKGRVLGLHRAPAGRASGRTSNSRPASLMTRLG